MTMPHDVFISYATRDKSTADAVCHALEAAGIRCWIAPRDAQPGQKYQGSLVRAIRSCRAMVLVFSAGANASEHVTREVSIAADAGKPVVPFRIEAVEMSDELCYYISSVHWLDALPPPVEAHIERLVQAVVLLMRGAESRDPAPERAAAGNAGTTATRESVHESVGPGATGFDDDTGRQDDETHHLIRAPVGGVLHTRLSPAVPSRVDLGDYVEVGDRLCTIHATRNGGVVINEIQADSDGKVVEVFEGHLARIGEGDPLFMIKAMRDGTAGRGDVADRRLRIRWDAMALYRRYYPNLEARPLVQAGQAVRKGDPLARVSFGVGLDGTPRRAVIVSPVSGRIVAGFSSSRSAAEGVESHQALGMFDIAFQGTPGDVSPFADVATVFKRIHTRRVGWWMLGLAVSILLLLGTFAIWEEGPLAAVVLSALYAFFTIYCFKNLRALDWLSNIPFAVDKDHGIEIIDRLGPQVTNR